MSRKWLLAGLAGLVVLLASAPSAFAASGGGCQLQGTVVASVTLPAINPLPGQPTSTTITTTRYAGGSSLGTLAFQPPDPTACNTPTGVTQAGISGFIGLGSS